MTRILTVAGVCALIALSPIACAPSSGRVADANWVPGTAPVCSGTGSSRTCVAGMPGHMQYDPQSWELRLIDGESDGRKDVDETTFHKCHVGDHFPEYAR